MSRMSSREQENEPSNAQIDGLTDQVQALRPSLAAEGCEGYRLHCVWGIARDRSRPGSQHDSARQVLAAAGQTQLVDIG